MAKIKIEDLSKDIEITKEEMKKVIGGTTYTTTTDTTTIDLGLQNTVNQEQQSLQIMSAVLKSQHDSSTTLIKNLK